MFLRLWRLFFWSSTPARLFLGSVFLRWGGRGLHPHQPVLIGNSSILSSTRPQQPHFYIHIPSSARPHWAQLYTLINPLGTALYPINRASSGITLYPYQLSLIAHNSTPSYCDGVETRSRSGGGIQSARPRWPARPSGIPDELTQWQGVGWIYWPDIGGNIFFWRAFIESCLPVR